MAKDNLITNTFRLNMNNPTHVKINKVLKNLNPKIYKSRNQFLIDAAVFFIEHYGDVAVFNRDVNTLANDHVRYDQGQIVYVDYEGMDATPSNYYDILAVYMVKYGVGDTATIMNDTSKAWLKTVVDDMCSYTTSTGSETETVTNEDGTTFTTTTTYLYVNVTLKSYRDMISGYGFDRNEVEMLEEMMSPEYLSMLGWSGGGGGGDSGVCSLTEAEINSILAGISNSTQKAVCSFALHRVGYPYSQELRDNGNYYDCSSLAYYSWRSAGVNISNGGATTASSEGQKLDEAGQTVSFDEMQPGDLIFYSYTNNGRYKNISHVAIYVGGGRKLISNYIYLMTKPLEYQSLRGFFANL